MARRRKNQDIGHHERFRSTRVTVHDPCSVSGVCSGRSETTQGFSVQRMIEVKVKDWEFLGKPAVLPEDEGWPPFNLTADHPYLSSFAGLLVLVIGVLLWRGRHVR